MPRCDLCGCRDFKFLFHKSGYSFIKCKDCFTLLTDPFPNEEEKRRFYGSTYYRSWDLRNPQQLHQFQQTKSLTFRKRLDLIETFRKKGRILDLGTATGYFVEMAKSRGWQAYGLEWSDYLAQIAKERLGNAIFQGLLKDARYEDNFFDVVTMLDVLEHLGQPTSELAEVHRILKPDGLLLITTPNAASPLCKVLGRRWHQFIPVEHIHYFSPYSIAKVLRQAGFEVKQIRPAVKVLSLSYLYMIRTCNVREKDEPNKKLFGVFLFNLTKQIFQILKLYNLPITVFTDEMMVLAKNIKTKGC